MPLAPLRPCRVPRCPELTRASYCPAHTPNQAQGWGTAGKDRIRGSRLQRLRADLFQRHPLCELCEAAGRVVVATIRDHRIPLAEGGRDDQANEQALCEDCHRAKTEAEKRRGLERNR